MTTMTWEKDTSYESKSQRKSQTENVKLKEKCTLKKAHLKANGNGKN